MGFVLSGWIEIQGQIYNQWIAAVRLSQPLLHDDNNKILHGYLFESYGNEESGPLNGLFNHRNSIPSDAAKQTKQDASSLGICSVLWSELKQIEWKERTVDGRKQKFIDIGSHFSNPTLTGGYALIFDLMKTLSTYHGDDKVHLVVWYE